MWELVSAPTALMSRCCSLIKCGIVDIKEADGDADSPFRPPLLYPLGVRPTLCKFQSAEKKADFVPCDFQEAIKAKLTASE